MVEGLELLVVAAAVVEGAVVDSVNLTPGLNGCVSSMDRSDDFQRIWIATTEEALFAQLNTFLDSWTTLEKPLLQFSLYIIFYLWRTLLTLDSTFLLFLWKQR